ncbi:META domain-containing protein [Sulfitobacter sp.]|uniref:META domain-containing protein n=1 Tax=Sulfitobacter sp. TaxID=1903071 RepID=UPI003002CD8C
MLKTISALLLAFVSPICATAGELTGTASYRERIALPPEAQFRATLYDVSNRGQTEIGRYEATGNSGPPYLLTITYADDAVSEGGRYALKTEILWPDRPYLVAGKVLDGFPENLHPAIDLVMARPSANSVNPETGVLTSDDAPESGTLIAGMMTYMADAAILEECQSGEQFPISQDSEYLALEHAYLTDRKEPGAPLFVMEEGTISIKAAMEGPARKTVTVSRFVQTRPGVTCERQRADASLRNTYWRLIELNGAAFPSLNSGKEPNIILETDTLDSYRATLGCNLMRGAVTIDGTILSFAPAASTMMACPDPIGTLEQQFSQALSAVAKYAIRGETLVFFDAEGEHLALFTAKYF